ncbi:MAG: SprB repeat-containing protein, partial [Bacteroidota bacterium]
ASDLGILDQQNIDCFGNNNGSLTFQAVGGTGPYRYSPDGVNFFPLSQAWDNLPPGADTLLAFDANDCLVPIPYLITEPAPINLQVDSLRTVDCFGDASGAIQITASGGTLPYQFQINGGLLQADSLFSNLLAGSYQIQLVDDSACTTSLDTIISQSAELILAADSVAMVDCWGNASGLIELSVQGGQMPYLIQENNGLFTNQLTYPGLIAGNYQYVVQDSLSCTDTLSIEISQPDSLISGIQQSVDILCFGDSTGSILLSTQGGTTPYIFQLGPASQNDSLFSNLPAGNYSITVLDQQGCSVLVEDSLTQPSLLEAEVELQDIRCFGEANGSIEVLGSGGVRPYQYQLGGSVPQSGNLIGPLSPGTYEITLTDDNGCSVLRSSLTLEEPDSLTVNLTGQDLTCYLAQNGQIRADIQGGNGGNLIEWQPANLPALAELDSLAAGQYRILVVDSLGCIDTSSIRLSQPDTLVMAQGEIVEAYCDFDNGAAAVMSLGGTPPYLYEWSGLPNVSTDAVVDVFGGTYLVRVIDQLGCEDTL